MTIKVDHVNPTPTHDQEVAKAKTIVPFVRSPYNYDMNKASDDTGLECRDPSLAQQQYAEESDINFIANKFGLTGEMPQIEGLQWGGEFDQVFDFQTAQNAVVAARDQFMTLPAKLRARFHNNPAELLDFMERAQTDEDTAKEAEFLGILKRREPMPEEVPQSPQGNATGKGKGGTLPPDPEPAAEPKTKTKKDT